MRYHRWRKNIFLGRSDFLFSKVPHIVAGIYALVSAVWIAFSDRLLVSLAGGYSQYQHLQTYKGWLFVSASALIMFQFLQNAWKAIVAAYETALESEGRLELALASADGGVWELNLAEGEEAIAFVSPQLTARLGLPPTQRLTLDEFRCRRHPDDVDRVDQTFEAFIKSGSQGSYEDRYRVRANNGSYRWVHSRGKIVAGKDGMAQRMVGVSLDITEQMEAGERVRQLLRYDPLTGLAKPQKFLSDIDDALARMSSGSMVGIVQAKLLDLDQLIGDSEILEDAKIVRAIGDRLQALSEAGFVACRVSTDIFAVATPALKTPEAVQNATRQVLSVFSKPLQVDDGCVRLRFLMGAALSPQDGDNAHILLRNSGHALGRADRTADAGIRWFTEGMDTESRKRNDRLRDLAGAVANSEIECHFQPVVDLVTGQTAGFEALARWRRRDEGLVSPDQFIGAAEELGLISEIGEDILRQACHAAAQWPGDSESAPFVAVNVSPIQLNDPSFPAVVARVLAESGLSPSRLELEITENALSSEPTLAARRLTTLRRLGISIAIDDFGTGYSSLALLSKFPFTRLKIDRSFIAGYGQRHESTIIVDMIIDLCRHLDLSITAEGVETSRQAALLSARGVTLAQGYRFSRAVPVGNATALLSRKWPVQIAISAPERELLAHEGGSRR
ncbi:putative bifunctional diguanylate cyclase/phosphodiesterase [Mesorhizobium sp. B1-1-8]|uniref:putative bifunctional diguanylate cyclase/phosphodiesterase n=1 Tax=Mesorhizobium sp. B1-1-8 TaxID=2589976 RepID=UPI001127940C|nr:bifunctional diguanylate cyclase/phosphodiesterase [Mesorhizobium sp. B1-1-8]UCI06155.1 EAL domain-containing protein [Mesorhizobium sp. B1-1-8]